MIERVPVMSLPQMSPQCLSLVATKASFTCLGGPVERVIRRHELTQMSAGIIPALDPTELFHRPARVPDSAVAAGAQYVVSHNTADFPPLVQGRHVHQNVEYLTAIEFVDDVLAEEAAQILTAPLPRGGIVRSSRTTAARGRGTQ